jgi:DNA-binding LacI/PurR family transcriptional regulator
VRPSALICDGAHKAEFVMRTLREGGISVPQDISVMACEAVLPSKTLVNELSRVQMPIAEIGRHGALLLHKIVSEPGMLSSDIRLAATLIEGATTAAVAAASQASSQLK